MYTWDYTIIELQVSKLHKERWNKWNIMRWNEKVTNWLNSGTKFFFSLIPKWYEKKNIIILSQSTVFSPLKSTYTWNSGELATIGFCSRFIFFFSFLSGRWIFQICHLILEEKLCASVRKHIKKKHIFCLKSLIGSKKYLFGLTNIKSENIWLPINLLSLKSQKQNSNFRK